MSDVLVLVSAVLGTLAWLAKAATWIVIKDGTQRQTESLDPVVGE